MHNPPSGPLRFEAFPEGRTDEQRLAFLSISKIIQPGGYLLLGWNTDKINDPVAEGLHQLMFTHTRLADNISPRIYVEGCTHVFDVFRANE
jgi:hypothetical protein